MVLCVRPQRPRDGLVDDFIPELKVFADACGGLDLTFTYGNFDIDNTVPRSSTTASSSPFFRTRVMLPERRASQSVVHTDTYFVLRSSKKIRSKFTYYVNLFELV